jgi:hypothetical protein
MTGRNFARLKSGYVLRRCLDVEGDLPVAAKLKPEVNTI